MSTGKKEMPKKNKGYGKTTMNSLWRKAVLANYNHRCAYCGNTDITEIECHHIVYRRHKILRWDYRNGIPGCKFTCHKIYHTKKGEQWISSVHRDYDLITSLENVTFKQYLVDNCLTEKEFLEFRKEEMRRLIDDKTNVF